MNNQTSLKRIKWISVLCCTIILSTLFTYPAPLRAEELNVALFQWVPRLQQFEEVIKDEWEKRHPEILLNFVTWDSYDTDPAETLDVFVFDGIFLSYYVQKGFLEPIDPSQIDHFDDLLPFVQEGTKVNGKYYGIPQLACSGFFYCRDKRDKGDDTCHSCIGSPNTLTGIYDYVGDNASPECIVPAPGSGLLMNLGGGTTCALLYLDAVQDLTGSYTNDPTLPPPDPKALNPSAISNLQLVVRMTGESQGRFSATQEYQRAGWFSSNSGKALVHYSESSWRMWYPTREKLLTKFMPLGPKPVNLLYVDIAVIKSGLNEKRKKLALELANLITCTDTMVKCLTPWCNGPDKSLQYLLPTRTSVFNVMVHLDDSGLYKQFFSILNTGNPKVFRIGTGVKQWFDSGIKNVIRAAIYKK